MKEDAHHNRRSFFRHALADALAPLRELIDARLPSLTQPVARQYVRLRPPGAIAEEEFLATCMRCGQCVSACPAHAIFPAGDADDRRFGTPVIDANRAACVICEGLQCTHVCPSGALLPLTHPWEIRMGLARVEAELCVRTSGESCALCVDRCPIGDAAIRFNDAGPPQVLAEGCTGCGVCQLYCPTTPKAIAVEPL